MKASTAPSGFLRSMTDCVSYMARKLDAVGRQAEVLAPQERTARPAHGVWHDVDRDRCSLPRWRLHEGGGHPDLVHQRERAAPLGGKLGQLPGPVADVPPARGQTGGQRCSALRQQIGVDVQDVGVEDRLFHDLVHPGGIVEASRRAQPVVDDDEGHIRLHERPGLAADGLARGPSRRGCSRRGSRRRGIGAAGGSGRSATARQSTAASTRSWRG